MARPGMIRADTIDLQDHDSPSAQNHSRSSPLQTNQSPTAASTSIGTSSSTVAPHQAETLREVAQETAEEELRSPRISWANSGAESGETQQYAADLAVGVTSSLSNQPRNGLVIGSDDDDKMGARGVQQDDLAVAQNGGLISQDRADDGELDGEESDLDDDMMDKISSSPSIDDGGFFHQFTSSDSVRQDTSPGSSPVSPYFSEARSSSPYLDLPVYLPLQRATHQQTSRSPVEVPARHHHLPGAFPEDLDEQPGYQPSEKATEPDLQKIVDQGILKRGGIQEPDRRADLGKPTMTMEEKTPEALKFVVEQQSETKPHTDVAEAICDTVDRSDEDDDDDDNDLVFSYEESTDEDDDDPFFQSTNPDPRFIDSGWGGECLHDTEDIDFELVYALHTFIATVEGQANATKGDAMVLLDDSNSYWWLVRVVKDSSIGYLPAEHIETPTERLARLNKHRNIDLSATMLGDQAEKVKNPIKTAMRRRKAKNVSFAAPTFVDYSDYDYDTSDEEDDVNNPYAQQQQAQVQQQQSQQQGSAAASQNAGDLAKDDEAAKVAPLNPRALQKTVQVVGPAKSDSKEDPPNKAARTSEEIFETNGVEGPKKKADGTVRDSFFKDDTVETKKITLTPNLLRDDGTARESTDSIDKGIIKRPSFDRLEKELKEDKKKGKEKKDKEKKGGFRGLFSRKDKKQRDEDDDSLGKRSVDMGKDSMERPSEDVSPESSPGTPQRSTSKLTKQQPRVEPYLSRKVGDVPRETGNGMDLSAFLKDTSSVPPASMRIVDPDADLFEDDDDDEAEKPQSSTAARSASVDDYKPAAAVQVRTRAQSVDDNKPAKPVKAVKPTPAKSRMQIEDSDSEEDVQELTITKTASSDRALVQPAAEQQQQGEPAAEPEPEAEPQPKPEQQAFQPTQQKPQRPVLPGTFPDSYVSLVSNESERTITADKPDEAKQRLGRLSESPIEVSPITPSESQPPPLTGDNSSQEERSSPVSSPSPELIDREEAAGVHRNQDSITTSTSTTTVSTWNDTSLRAFFDSGADIRDLLVVVYDKTDVEPVGPDHPVAGVLFKEQNAKLAEITTQLDNMLGDWLARKQRLRGTV